MLDFEGEISETSRRSNDRVVFENENENEDVIYELDSTMASLLPIIGKTILILMFLQTLLCHHLLINI